MPEIQRRTAASLPKYQAFYVIGVMASYVGVALAIMVSLFVIAIVAIDSRESIEAGNRPGFVFGLPAPWSAQSANVHTAPGVANGASGDDLPECALFLGQADGMVVLRDGSARTLRVPAATLRLDLHDRKRCPT